MIDWKTTRRQLSKHRELLLHLFGWVFLLGIWWGLSWGRFMTFDRSGKVLFGLGLLLFPMVFYINIYVVIPYFQKREKAILYGILSIVIILFLEAIKHWLFGKIRYYSGIEFDFISFTDNYVNAPFFNGLLLALGYSSIKYLDDYSRLVERLKTEKHEIELAFLKTQVNPHFLFNTLNALYAVALQEKSPFTADGIAKLGSLMRYNLHDSQASFISLTKEMEYIENYIALQRLRTTPQNYIEFKKEILDATYEDREIAPMLLIPFVENAFKYGISPTEQTMIKIQMSLKNGIYLLAIQNTIIFNVDAREKSGIGLDNAKKRLELIYPNRHQLHYGEKNGCYSVQLKIRLH